MKNFFNRNIDRRGRIVRAVLGATSIIAGAIAWQWAVWAGVALIAAGVFAIFEAVRGWCLMRACGIRTKY